jgi:hypothetical protein
MPFIYLTMYLLHHSTFQGYYNKLNNNSRTTLKYSTAIVKYAQKRFILLWRILWC